MTDVVLFHHAQGLTEGCRTFAARLALYGGERHLFMDDALHGYDHAVTELVIERIVGLLDRVG